MGAEHFTMVFFHSQERGSRLVVLMAIAANSDQHGQWTVDLDLLERLGRMNRRRVQGTLRELLDGGELAAVQDDQGRVSAYRVLTGGAKSCTPSRGKKGQKTQDPAPAQNVARVRAKNCAPETPLSPSFPLDPQSPPEPPSPPPTLVTSTVGGPRSGSAPAARPLSGSQLAVATVNELLGQASVPLPDPSQIGLWASTIGLDDLLDLLAKLINKGLAHKRRPERYIHEVVMQRAGVKPARRPAGGRPLSRNAAAGVDERRRQQAAALSAAAREDA